MASLYHKFAHGLVKGGPLMIYPQRKFQLYRLADLLAMIEINADTLFGLATTLGKTSGLSEAINEFSAVIERRHLTLQSVEPVRRSLAMLRGFLDSLKLDSAVAQADRICEALDTPEKLDHGTLFRMTDELVNRVTDQLKSTVFLVISSSGLEYYDNMRPFGHGVELKFPKAAYDIEEAAKCYALGRGTASVMHLMRVIEAAIAAVALGVGLNPNAVENIKAWESMLKEIKKAMHANAASNIPAWTASKDFFEDALAYFYAVKDAWRNPTMHLERKYTEEEAGRIYVAVKNLMTRLSEHLDQSGVYTA